MHIRGDEQTWTDGPFDQFGLGCGGWYLNGEGG